MKSIGLVTVLAVALAGSSGVADDYLVIVSPGSSASLSSAQSACTAPDSAACAAALEGLARRAAEDLVIVGNSRDRALRPLVLEYAALPYPSVRAAAAGALGAFGPDATDTPLLAELLNDAVPVVRNYAQRALQASGDDGARRLARRAASSQGQGLSAQVAPTAADLGGALYPRARYLYFASTPAKGVAAFVSDDPVGTVEKYFAARSKGPAMSAEQLAEAGSAEPDMETQVAMAMGMAEEYQKLMDEGKSPEEIGRIMGARASATMGEDVRDFANDFSDDEVFGTPGFYVLEKAEATGRPTRVAAVFRDLALGKTGIVIKSPATGAE